MKKNILSSIAIVIGSTVAGCQGSDDAEQLMDPLSSAASCSEGFQYASELQSLEVKNTGVKPIRIVNITGIDNGTPHLGVDSAKFVTIAAGQSHKFSFFVDSYTNGGSMLYQADDAGKRTITIDSSCTEALQAPVYIRQSEGEDAWIVVGVGDAQAQVRHISLDDAWASEKSGPKSHIISINDKGSADEAFSLKP